MCLATSLQKPNAIVYRRCSPSTPAGSSCAIYGESPTLTVNVVWSFTAPFTRFSPWVDMVYQGVATAHIYSYLEPLVKRLWGLQTRQQLPPANRSTGNSVEILLLNTHYTQGTSYGRRNRSSLTRTPVIMLINYTVYLWPCLQDEVRLASHIQAATGPTSWIRKIKESPFPDTAWRT